MFNAALQYAFALGVKKLLLREPLPSLIARYERFGFTLVHNAAAPIYLERILTEERIS